MTVGEESLCKDIGDPVRKTVEATLNALLDEAAFNALLDEAAFEPVGAESRFNMTRELD